MTEKKTQVITIDEVEYNVEDFTDEQRVLINHVMDLDRKIGSTKFNLDQLNVGRGAFMNMLSTSLKAEPQEEAAQLMSQLTPEELEAMLDRAAKKGAAEALRSLGLQDEDAAGDIRDMRNLIDAWRMTKKSIWATTVKLGTVAVLTFIATAVWMSIK